MVFGQQMVHKTYFFGRVASPARAVRAVSRTAHGRADWHKDVEDVAFYDYYMLFFLYACRIYSIYCVLYHMLELARKGYEAHGPKALSL